MFGVFGCKFIVVTKIKPMSNPMQSLALELAIVVPTFNEKANIDETYFLVQQKNFAEMSSEFLVQVLP